MTPSALPALVLQTVALPDVWVSLEAVGGLESYADGGGAISAREIQRRIADGRYVARDTAEKSANGRPIREILLSSLSPAAQAKHLARARDVADGIAAPLPAVREAVTIPERRIRGAAIPTLRNGDVDVDALRRAGRHADFAAYLKRSHAVAVCMADLGRAGIKHGQRRLIWARLAVGLNTPAETLRCWLKRYEAGGSVALVPGYGHNRGLYRSLPEALRAAIRATYLNQQQQAISQVMQNCVRPWCAKHGCIPPNRTTVARFLDKEVFACEITGFRHGSRAWAEIVQAKVHRDPASLAVNDLWCADHRKFDVFVLTPDGKDVLRPWLTTYVDIASADFTGWCLRDRPTAQSVSLALRAGIVKRGVPRVLYHDNGKEFVARRFGGKEPWRFAHPAPEDCARDTIWPAVLPEKYDSEIGFLTLYDIGIHRVIHALPYRAWSKPIESMFRAFHRTWENLMPGYCGNRPGVMPEKCRREVADRRLLTWDQFVAIFSKHMDEWAANHRCGDRPKTPDEFYAAADAELRRCPDGKLDGFLFVSENRVIPAEGIEICGKRFLDEQLALFVGERAAVLYDPDHLTHVIVKPLRYQGQKRLIVSEIPNAGWFEFSEANRIAQGINKTRRAMIRLIATSDRAALLPEYVDPSGANRMAYENAMAHRAAAATALADPSDPSDPAHPSDLAALKAAQRADKADSTARETGRKRRAAGVAAQIAAQAQTEAAYRAGS